MLRRSSLRRCGGADRRVPKSGSGESEGQPAQRPLRSGACRKAEAVSPKTNPPSGRINPPRAISETEGRRTNPPRATPKRCVPKSESREPEGQPDERPAPNREAEAPTRRAATPKRRVPKSGSCEPEGQPAERKRQPAERQSPKRRQRRAAKTTQDERSPSAGRSRETRGRRSSADTPTNTIEKRDCDTLRPSEAS